MATYSYHGHTRWSDGKCTVAEMFGAAAAAGLDEYGLSDHWTIPPGASQAPDWAMSLDSLPQYVDEVRSEGARSRLTARIGLEVDFFPATFSRALALVEPFSFDYLIGSVHFADEFPIDARAADWDGMDQAAINRVFIRYWELIKELAERGGVNWIGHLDLPKKFGHQPTVDLAGPVEAALDAIARAGLPIELNTAGWHRPCKEAYPAEFLLHLAKARKIPVLISDDAHSTEQVAQSFDRAVALLRLVGYRETIRFQQRQGCVVPLD